MNAYDTYQSASSLSWTRVDMLLLIYDKLIQRLQEGIELLERDSLSELGRTRFHVQQCLVTIIEGLNPDVDDTPRQVMRLSLFVLDQIQTESVVAWKSSLGVIQTLREGFESIQHEAREAENQDLVPALNARSL